MATISIQFSDDKPAKGSDVEVVDVRIVSKVKLNYNKLTRAQKLAAQVLEVFNKLAATGYFNNDGLQNYDNPDAKLKDK